MFSLICLVFLLTGTIACACVSVSRTSKLSATKAICCLIFHAELSNSQMHELMCLHAL